MSAALRTYAVRYPSMQPKAMTGDLMIYFATISSYMALPLRCSLSFYSPKYTMSPNALRRTQDTHPGTDSDDTAALRHRHGTLHKQHQTLCEVQRKLCDLHSGCATAKTGLKSQVESLKTLNQWPAAAMCSSPWTPSTHGPASLHVWPRSKTRAC